MIVPGQTGPDFILPLTPNGGQADLQTLQPAQLDVLEPDFQLVSRMELQGQMPVGSNTMFHVV